jgi:hypothetical protein
MRRRAVEGEVPGDAYQPDAHLADVLQRGAVFEDADEDILDDVLCLGPTAEDGVCDPEEERRVCLHEGRKVDRRPVSFHGRQSQAAFLDRRHESLLLRQTGEGGIRSDFFLRTI